MFKTFLEVSKLNADQILVIFALPEEEKKTFDIVKKVLKLDASQCTSFRELPEENRTASNLPTSTPARANFQDNIADQRARVMFIPRRK